MLEGLLPLDRPLVVFDTETTGTNPRTDRIVEIACVKVHPDGRSETWQARLNPGIPIPPGSTAIHKISDRDVAGCPGFKDVAQRLAAFLDGCDLGGYNITGFDLPVLRIEFLRAGVAFDIHERRLVDAQRIFFAREPRHLTAAARFYCDVEHNGAHGALADAEMTLRVLAGELKRYADLPRTVGDLHELFCAGLDQDMDPEGRFRMVNGEATVNFGKNRGRTLREMSRSDPGFLKWILKGDFSAPAKEIARRFLPPEPQQSLGTLGDVFARPNVPSAPEPPAPALASGEGLASAATPELMPAMPLSTPPPAGSPGETMDLFAALEEPETVAAPSLPVIPR